MKMEKYIDSSTDIYSLQGYKSACQIRDVVFIYRGDCLFHFTGTFLGWEFFQAIPMQEDQVETWIAKGRKMKLNSKQRYSIKIMEYLKENPERIRGEDLCKLFGFSQAYLEQVLKGLVKCGFVSARKGKKGGYKRIVETITLTDIIESQQKYQEYDNLDLLIKRKLREITF